MKIKFVEWDFKEQIDPELLREALVGVFGGENIPYITDVEETDTDSFVVVVSEKNIDKEQAQDIFDKHREKKKSPFENVIDIKWP